MAESSVLTIISSPSHNPDHWTNRIVDSKRSDGTPLVIDASFSYICEECKKLPLEQMVKCRCMGAKGSHTKSSQKRNDLIASGIISAEDAAIELLGEGVDTSEPAFPSALIDRVFDRANFVKRDTRRNTIRAFFMCVDPSGEGKNHTAIDIGYFDKDGNYVVCYIEDAKCSSSGEGGTMTFGALIATTIQRFRTARGEFRVDSGVPLIIVVEANHGNDASHVEEIVRANSHAADFANCFVMYGRNGNTQAGIWKDKSLGVDYVRQFRAMLVHNRFRMSVDTCTSVESTARVDELLEHKRSQLRAFRDPSGDSENPRWRGNKRRWTGGKGPGGFNDDSAIASLMGPVWASRFLYDPSFGSQRRQCGLD